MKINKWLIATLAALCTFTCAACVPIKNSDEDSSSLSSVVESSEEISSEEESSVEESSEEISSEEESSVEESSEEISSEEESSVEESSEEISSEEESSVEESSEEISSEEESSVEESSEEISSEEESSVEDSSEEISSEEESSIEESSEEISSEEESSVEESSEKISSEEETSVEESSFVEESIEWDSQERESSEETETDSNFPALANPATNWAEAEYQNYWAVSGATLGNDGTTVTVQKKGWSISDLWNPTEPWISVSSDLLKAAVDAGYTKVAVVSRPRNNGWDNWFSIYAPDKTTVLRSSSSGENVLKAPRRMAVYLEDLYDASTGKYFMYMTTEGWSSSQVLEILSLTFYGKDEPKKEILDYTDELYSPFVNVQKYEILLPETPTPAEEFAAEELIYFYEKATGKTLSVSYGVAEENGYYISIGNTALYEDHADVNLDSYTQSGYSIRKKGNNIMLNSVGEYGKIFAVYGFMEAVFGLQIYAEEVFDFSKADTERIGVLNVRHTPDFALRSAGVKTGMSIKTQLRMRLTLENTEYGLSDELANNGAFRSHTFLTVCPPSEYQEAHRTWFACDENDKAKTLCLTTLLTDTEMQAVILDAYKAEISKDTTSNYFNFGCEDIGHPECSCENCKTEMKKYDGNALTRGFVALQMKAVNLLADRVHEWLENHEDPAMRARADKVKIGVFAYSGYSYPPMNLDFRLSDNAFIYFAPIGLGHQEDLDERSQMLLNKRFYEAIYRWREIANHFAIWSYSSSFWDFIAPFDDIETAQSFFQMFKLLNPAHMYTQAPMNTQMESFEALRLYVFTQLMLDTTRTVAEIKAEFFKGYYGIVAQEMEAYYNVINAKLDALVASGVTTGTAMVPIYKAENFSYEELQTYVAMLNAILAKAANDEDLYNRILPETMFPRCALLDFYRDQLIADLGAKAVAEEIFLFQQQAMELGMTHLGMYSDPDGLMNTKIAGWKDEQLIPYINELITVEAGENYALSEYDHLWSTSHFFLNFQQNGGIKIYRDFSAMSDFAVSVDSVMFEKAVAAGMTYVTITSHIGSNADHWAYVDNATKTVASKHTKGTEVNEMTVKIADLWDEETQSYVMKFTTNGWWGGVSLYIDSLVFFNPLDYLQNADNNWVSQSSCWSTTAGTLKLSGGVLQQSYANGAVVSFDGEILAAAVKVGYTKVSIVTYGNFNFRTEIKNPNDTKALAAAGGKGSYTATSPWVATVSLADLLNKATGEYELKMTTSGWWANGPYWNISSLTFSK